MQKNNEHMESNQQLELILVLSQQEKNITHLRNLIQERDNELTKLHQARSDEVLNIVKTRPKHGNYIIETLTAEVKGLKERLFNAECQFLDPIESSQRLKIQNCCTMNTIVPNPLSLSLHSKNKILLPPMHQPETAISAREQNVDNIESPTADSTTSSRQAYLDDETSSPNLKSSNSDEATGADEVGSLVQSVSDDGEDTVREKELLQAKIHVQDAKLD